MRDEEFEWDDAKAAENYAKHGITFEQARDAYRDPAYVERDDPDPDEERYSRFCMSGLQVLVVIYTERDGRVRIISARKANRHEQRIHSQP